MTAPLITITPDDYARSSHEAAFADLLTYFAGVEKNDCTLIELIDGEWCFTVYIRNEDGQIILEREGGMKRTIRWHVRRTAKEWFDLVYERSPSSDVVRLYPGEHADLVQFCIDNKTPDYTRFGIPRGSMLCGRRVEVAA